MRADSSKDSNRYIFIPIDIHDVKDTKNSFKKLCRACVPSAASNELINEMQQFHSKQQNFLNNKKNSNATSSVFSGGLGKISNNSNSKLSRNSKKMGLFSGSNAAINQFNTNINYHHGVNTQSSQTVTTGGGANGSSGFFKQIQDSKWFDQLQLIIHISNLVVERMEESSSVMIALEDGWDLTSQVTTLAQVLLDPYYRTIEGFSVLIEREWLSMGHRFSRRSNQTADDQTGFAPIFLQFLDVVHQCLNQNLAAFEFNEFYLEFLAYHYVSNRFKTFLLDSELERLQFGILSDSLSSLCKQHAYTTGHLHTNVSHAFANSIPANTTCIWQYILKVHYNSAKFFNFNYQPNTWTTLRPSGEFYKLKLWRYFIKETLCTGPIYDLDLLTIGNLNYNNNNNQTNPTTTTNVANTNTNNTSISNNGKSSCLPMANADEFWYPVPVQNASDYYEQLDQILPSQYEILLKQIMRKYKLNEVNDFKIKSSELSSVNHHTSQPQSPSSSIVSSMSSSSLSHATTDLLNKLLNNNDPISNSNESNGVVNNNVNHVNNNASHNAIPLNWKNVWDYFYQMVSFFYSKGRNLKKFQFFSMIKCIFSNY